MGTYGSPHLLGQLSYCPLADQLLTILHGTQCGGGPATDIVEATYLLPPLDVPVSTEDLIVHHAQQLQKRPEDVHEMSARVLKARKQSAAQFVKHFSSTIQEYDFEVRSLVLVHNSHIEKELNCKTKPCFGPHGGGSSYQGWHLFDGRVKQCCVKTLICSLLSHPLLGKVP